MGRCDAAKVGMCVLKDVQVLSLLLLLDFSRVRNGRQPAEYGWEELSDSRCSVVLRCGSVCAYEYASTISLACGRWSSYCSAGRERTSSKIKARAKPDVLNAPADWQFAHGAGQAAKASPSLLARLCHKRLRSVSAPICAGTFLHLSTRIILRRAVLFFGHMWTARVPRQPRR